MLKEPLFFPSKLDSCSSLEINTKRTMESIKGLKNDVTFLLGSELMVRELQATRIFEALFEEL